MFLLWVMKPHQVDIIINIHDIPNLLPIAVVPRFQEFCTTTSCDMHVPSVNRSHSLHKYTQDPGARLNNQPFTQILLLTLQYIIE